MPNHRSICHNRKYNADMAKTITDTIRAGGSIELAAQRADVPITRLTAWLKRGESTGVDDPKSLACKKLAREVAVAKGDAEMRNLLHVQKVDDWKAATWWLERARPDQWNYHSIARKDDSKPTQELSDFLRENHDAMVDAEFPPGSMPTDPSPGTFQNSAGGPPLGQDGSLQTQTGVGPVASDDAAEK